MRLKNGWKLRNRIESVISYFCGRLARRERGTLIKEVPFMTFKYEAFEIFEENQFPKKIIITKERENQAKICPCVFHNYPRH